MDWRTKKFRQHVEEELKRQLPLPFPSGKEIPVEVLRELLDYDPETGTLTWKKRDVSYFPNEASCRSWNTRYAGRTAFTYTHFEGYKYGGIFSASHKAHRVAWAIYNGEWPKDHIDHINGNRADNRIVNLRVVSCSENLRNQKIRKNNKSGVMGVSWRSDAGKWVVRITVNSRLMNLGLFSSFDEAVAVRKAAEREYGYHENHGRVTDETSGNQE